jgi:hypothetical protein
MIILRRQNSQVPIPVRSNPYPILDAELTRHFTSLELKKKRNRWRYIRNFGILWGSIFLLGFLAYLGLDYKNALLYSGAFFLAFIGGIISVPLTIGLISDIHSPLSPVDMGFVKVYKALANIELPKKVSKQNEDTEVEQHAYELLESSMNDLDSHDGRAALAKEAELLVKQVLKDVGTRLVPAAEEGNLNAKTLEEFAKVLSSPTLPGLKAFDETLQKEFPNPREIEKVSLRKTVTGFFGTRKGQAMLAFLYGYVLIIALALVAAVVTQQDPLTFGKTNAGAILSVGAIVSIGFLSFMKK